MEISPIFQSGQHRAIAEAIRERLNARCDLQVRGDGAHSGVGGDLIEWAVGEELPAILGDACIGQYVAGTGQRARADIVFVDQAGFRHEINVKGQDLGRTFHMPNLVSADNIRRFFVDSLQTRQHYDLIVVRYRLAAGRIQVEDVLFFPMEWVDWSCLAIQMIGKGMVQFRSSKITLDPSQTRQNWVAELLSRWRSYYLDVRQKAEVRARNIEREIDLWNQACTTGGSVAPAVFGAGDGQMTLF